MPRVVQDMPHDFSRVEKEWEETSSSGIYSWTRKRCHCGAKFEWGKRIGNTKTQEKWLQSRGVEQSGSSSGS